MSLLELSAISKNYEEKKVLQEINLLVKEAEIVGLAGESGSGKSTLARIVSGMESPDSGTAKLENGALDLYSPRQKELKQKIQLIFQNALGSFNPKFTLRSSLREPIIQHFSGINKSETEEKIHQVLEAVNLEKNLLDSYPHQVSGGQIQRAAIARAISCEPKLLIADEPTSALDISIRGQILRLFKKLSEERGIACLIISHDLPSLKFLTKRIYVLNQGRVVESGETPSLMSNPREAYTRRLISAIPSLNPADNTFAKFQ